MVLLVEVVELVERWNVAVLDVFLQIRRVRVVDGNEPDLAWSPSN